MVKTKFNLSEEVITLIDSNCLDDELKGANIILTIKVREFIKRLKMKSEKGWEGYVGLVHIDDIIKLAGDKFA